MKTKQPGSWKSVTSFVLGMIGLGTWFFPLFGLPLTVTGLVLGILGITGNTKRSTATAGVILCGIGLLLTISIIIYGTFFARPAAVK